MSKPLIILGAGGHAKVLADTLLSAGNTRIQGFTDPDASLHGSRILGLPVLGGDDAIPFPSEVELVDGLGSVASTARRQALFEHFKQLGYHFATVIHPGACLGRETVVGEGVQVMAGAVIQTGSRVADNCIINTRAVVEHDCVVGEHVHIAPGAVLSGGVRLDAGCHVGTGAVIIQGIHLGAGAVVGAGATVIHDVPSGITVVGVPARALRS